MLADPERISIASDFVRLEVLPKALFHVNIAEANLYEAFFASAAEWVNTSAEVLAIAFDQARLQNLNAVDALHVAAALQADADELVTTERPTSALLRVTGLRTTTIYRP